MHEAPPIREKARKARASSATVATPRARALGVSVASHFVGQMFRVRYHVVQMRYRS